MQSRFEATLLAETLRHHRDGRALLLEHERARERAAAHGGSPPEKLLHWATEATAGTPLAATVRDALARLRLAVHALLVVTLLAGAAASAAALGVPTGGAVNALWAMVLLVAVPLAFLLLWSVLTLLAWLRDRSSGRTGTGGTLLRVLSGLAGTLLRFTGSSGGTAEDRRAAMAALLGLLARGPLGRWSLGTVTHLAWLAFALGALLASWVRLTVVQYDFVWGTTILADEVATSLLLALTWWPATLGFAAPDADLLLATRAGAGQPGVGREVWGGFLIGALIAYVALPRLVLAAGCGALAMRAAAAIRPDPGHRLFQEALLRLRASTAEAPLGEPPPDDVLHRSAAPAPHPNFGSGDWFALLGIELERSDAWPPQHTDWEFLLGEHLTTRAQQREAVAHLKAMTETPRFVAAVASLPRTPDRGTMDLLGELAAAARAPVLLILSESEILRERGGDPERRLADWRERAAGAGVNAAIAMDSDALPGLRQSELEQHLREAGVQ